MKLNNLFDPRRYGMLMLEEDGGGGGAAVAEAPAQEASPNAAPIVDAEILNFEPPSLEGNDFLNGSDDEPPVAKNNEKPPVEEKPQQQQEKGKPGPKPAQLLRTELESTREELKQAREQLAKGDPRIADFEQSVKAKEAEVSEARKQAEDYRKQLALADPAVTKELREMDSKYESDASRFYAGVPELEHAQVKGLVAEYDSLPFGTAGYREARMNFEAKVNELLGGTEGSEHRKLGRAMDWIEKTHEFATTRPQIQQKIERSAFDLQRQAKEEGWSKEQKSVREQIAAAREVPDDLRASQPYHPRVVIDAFTKSLKPEDAAKIEEGIPEFVELVTAGVRPRGDKDFAGMSPEQIKEARAEEQGRYETARGQLPAVLYNGLRGLRLVPTLMKENQRLREKLGEREKAAPPDPTAGGETGDGKQVEDYANFQIPKFNI